ncbi:MAG: hypothetical protein QF441_02685 [Bacteriovoracaceae bacterium]|nr:hypothetical protein [Halobacteriovoraceae bacterium]MDP7319481.1 hypothetical protein [Bacteriovoracaceae bacterium]
MTPNLNRFIREIKHSFFCDDEYIRNILAVTKNEYDKKLQQNNFSLKDLINLSDYFQININDIANGSVDYKQIKTKFYNPSSAIPTKYVQNAGTYMSNIRAIINHIRDFTNDKTAQYLINKYGISKEALINDSLMVNIKLANSLLADISDNYNISDSNYLSMAMLSYKSQSRNKLISETLRNQSGLNIAKHVAKNALSYDKNFIYTVTPLNYGQFIFSGTIRPEVKDIFHTNEITNIQAIKFRAASIQALSILSNNGYIEVQNIETPTSQSSETFHIYMKNTAKQQTSLLQ